MNNTGDDKAGVGDDDNGGKKHKELLSSSATFWAVQQLKEEALHKLRAGGESESVSIAAVLANMNNIEGRLVLHHEQNLSAPDGRDAVARVGYEIEASDTLFEWS